MEHIIIIYIISVTNRVFLITSLHGFSVIQFKFTGKV